MIVVSNLDDCFDAGHLTPASALELGHRLIEGAHLADPTLTVESDTTAPNG